MTVEKSAVSLWLSRSSQIILLASLALCLAFACLIWQAGIARADGSVTYEQRNYAVRIQRDGMIQVNEHWQVHFSGGPFHHAFLALYLAKTSGITFGQVTGESVTNQQVSETTDASGNPMVQVAWDYPETTDATRTFDIPYTVQGALGIGTSQAWLDWHFLDGGSETNFPVNAAEVRVTLPAAADAQQLSVNTSDSDGALQTATPDTRTVVVTGGHLTSNVPLEVEVAFPRDQIDASVARPAWQSTDTPPTLPTALGVGQPVSDPGSYNPGTGDYGASPVSSFNPLDIFGPMLTVCFLPLGLLVLSALGLGRKGGGWGYRGGSRFWNNTGGPWYRGPWTNGGGPWMGGGGGFGGGSGFGGGGSGGGGGGGGGGSSGFS